MSFVFRPLKRFRVHILRLDALRRDQCRSYGKREWEAKRNGTSKALFFTKTRDFFLSGSSLFAKLLRGISVGAAPWLLINYVRIFTCHFLVIKSCSHIRFNYTPVLKKKIYATKRDYYTNWLRIDALRLLITIYVFFILNNCNLIRRAFYNIWINKISESLTRKQTNLTLLLKKKFCTKFAWLFILNLPIYLKTKNTRLRNTFWTDRWQVNIPRVLDC